jgi:hypothetical protein
MPGRANILIAADVLALFCVLRPFLGNFAVKVDFA